MTIGIPKEIKEQEQRVGLLPSTAQTLVGHGHTVLVQKNAGVGSGYPDEEYVKAGAQIVESAEEIFQRADMIVKVKEPLPAEWPLLRRGQILFTYLHLAASKPLTEALLNVWRDRRCVRDDSNRKSPSAFGTNERNRGPYVGCDGRILFGKT